MDYKINGRTALVLGAGGGLGSAVCDALAREGVRVAAVDISADALSAVKARLDDIGSPSFIREWDLSDLDAIAGHIAAIESALGPIDIIFNNTGGPAPSRAESFDVGAWSRQFQAMVMSVMAIASHVVPGMRERKWGRVITSASSGVVAPIPDLAISNSLRLALVGWSKTLAREVAADGVTVNVVIPGRIATGRVRFLDEAKAAREGTLAREVAAQSEASIPAGRYGNPEEYANAVAFLASHAASYITGTQLRVDGGLLASI